MGIFDNAPHLKEKRNLDPANLDPGLKQVLEEMGVIKEKIRPKAKPAYFSDIIVKTSNESSPEIIDTIT